jgi:hypothetical protein
MSPSAQDEAGRWQVEPLPPANTLSAGAAPRKGRCSQAISAPIAELVSSNDRSASDWLPNSPHVYDDDVTGSAPDGRSKTSLRNTSHNLAWLRVQALAGLLHLEEDCPDSEHPQSEIRALRNIVASHKQMSPGE